MFGLLERYQVFEQHFGVYRFLASTGIDIAHLVVFLFVGCAVAFLAREAEVVATMTLAMIYGAMTVLAFVYLFSRAWDFAVLWRLPWNFADCFALVIAGVTVRMRRISHTSRPSGA
jgi:hypothetical protein